MSEIKVKYLIDKKNKRVLFAEAGGDFVDVMFSFLTLPLMRIPGLSEYQTGVSCSLYNLHMSVHDLDNECFQTKGCKEMLFDPRSAAAEICEDLKIEGIHDENPRVFYTCKNADCFNQSPYYYFYVNDGGCPRCGCETLDQMLWLKETGEKDGVFVNDKDNYFITDDFRVIPSSLASGFSLAEKLGIKDLSVLFETEQRFCSKKIFELLRRSLVSNCAFSDIFYNRASKKKQSVKVFSEIKKEIDNSEAEYEIKIKIILNKKNNNVFYAEVGGEFLNHLVSFLALPLGSLYRLFSDDMPLKGCISNLYSSASSLNLKYFKSEKCKNMLLCPQLASYYRFTKQLLKVDEMTRIARTKKSISNYDSGWYNKLRTCSYEEKFKERNPKLVNGGSDSGGSYIKDTRRFLVFDDLRISSFYAISAMTEVISAIQGVDFPMSDITEIEVNVGEIEVLSLLRAMLTSKTVLTDAFLPHSNKRRC